MAVKVGESWVTEEALAYAKGKVNSEAEATLKDLSDRYPGVNFSMNTAPFSQEGTNNVQIAPNILAEMKNDPEKRLEYEALIYDCAQLVYDGKMSQSGNGFHIKASGTIINADGSLSGWAISESDDGRQVRNKTNLDKTKKETWADKILAKQKEKRAEAKKEEAIRIEKQREKRAELSDKAQALLEELKQKYSNMDFFVADYSSGEEASRIMSMGTKEYSVLLEPETLEAMANDEEMKNKYLGLIDGATEDLGIIKEELGEEADNVSHIGFTVSKDGSVSFFAELEKSSEKQRERIEKAREEKAEEKKEEEKKANKQNPYEKNQRDSIKRTTVEASTMEELIEKIKGVDWDKIPGIQKYTGARFSASV